MPINHKGPQHKKDEKVIKEDSLYLILKDKTPADVEAYFAANLSVYAFYSDTEIDSAIDTLDNTQLKSVLKVLAKDNAFQTRTQLLMVKMLNLIARKW